MSRYVDDATRMVDGVKAMADISFLVGSPGTVLMIVVVSSFFLSRFDDVTTTSNGTAPPTFPKSCWSASLIAFSQCGIVDGVA